MSVPSSSTLPSRPVTEIILKVHSRCNLACTYCYVYELEDDGWKRQPGAMETETLKRIIFSAAEYGPDRLRVIFHGGEPLLRGAEWLSAAAASFRKILPSCRLSFGMQTNAALLTPRRLGILKEAGIRLGISYDGDMSRRPYRGGRSSQARISEALQLVRDQYREIYGGLLTAVDPVLDPVETYEKIAAFRPPSMDLLLPLATHDSPPPPGCGEWLVKLFTYWHDLPAEDAPDIRLFRVITERLLGRDRRAGFIGPPPEETSVVFQPDGSAELADALTVVGNGAAKTGMNIRDHSLEQIAAHPGYVQPPMCSTCADCRLAQVCGGGFWVTRCKGGSFGFPSVYCEDLMLLIDAVRAALEARKR